MLAKSNGHSVCPWNTFPACQTNYCEHCKVAGHLCTTQSEYSLITTFTWFRQIGFIDIGKGKFMMWWSCLYQSTFGLLSRLLIKPHQTLSRDCNASFQIPCLLRTTEEFNRNERSISWFSVTTNSSTVWRMQKREGMDLKSKAETEIGTKDDYYCWRNCRPALVYSFEDQGRAGDV